MQEVINGQVAGTGFRDQGDGWLAHARGGRILPWAGLWGRPLQDRFKEGLAQFFVA